MSRIKNITSARLAEILSKITGTTAVSLIAVTNAGLKKMNNPYNHLGGVVKVARVNGMVGTDHAKAVVRQQAREGVEQPAYQAAERSWGTRRGALIEHKGEHYIPIQLNPTARVRPIYLAPKVRGSRVRLMPVAKETIAAFLPADRSAQDATHQGVERAVVRRDYALSNLAQISINGERYRVRE